MNAQEARELVNEYMGEEQVALARSRVPDFLAQIEKDIHLSASRGDLECYVNLNHLRFENGRLLDISAFCIYLAVRPELESRGFRTQMSTEEAPIWDDWMMEVSW